MGASALHNSENTILMASTAATEKWSDVYGLDAAVEMFQVGGSTGAGGGLTGYQREAYDRQVVTALQESKVDLICLAGYMRILSREFLKAYRGRILNIHPSLLPSFPGLDAQKQALEHGAKETGCTVHFVDETLDGGPIIAQRVVPVLEGDTVETLAARILEQEHKLYRDALRSVLKKLIPSVGANSQTSLSALS